jgi:hypothetical protein
MSVIRERQIEMNRRRIEASEIFSIPESASLDTLTRAYPGSVEASMLDQGGDLYLRIASGRSKDIEMTEEDIEEKIQEWKTHTKEHATNAGFRKANKGRGPMDPRRFALQLAEAARLNANRYRSPSLLRLAKQLKWVAGQERGVAARALARMAAPLEEEARRRDQTGMPVMQKPQDQVVLPSSEFTEKSRLIPGEPIEYNQDQSWRARESGRFAKEKEIDSELVTMARDFLQDYKSRNSLYDTDLLDQLQDPDVFESWLLDLDSKGVNPDSGQLDEAWNQAMNEIAEGSGESLPEELGGEDLSPVSATRGGETTIQRETAPGGDWFNTVINLHENPVMDRYLRDMRDKREGRSRVSRKIEVEDEIAAAVDQTLDHFAGDMLPSEISSDHVQKFVEDHFPDVSSAKVYKAIQEIADPRKRHEEKERTNQESSRRVEVSSRRAKTNRRALKNDPSLMSRLNHLNGFTFADQRSALAQGISPEDWAAAKANGWLVRDPAGGVSLEIPGQYFGQGASQVPQTQQAPQTQQTQQAPQRSHMMGGGWSDPITSILRSKPNSTVVLKNGERVRVNPLNPVNIAGNMVTLIDDREVPMSGVQQVLDPQGRPIGGSRRTNGRSGLRRYREICAHCKGIGERGERCCGQCRGSGQTDVSAFDENFEQKEKVAARLGSLTLVSVDVGNRAVSREGRQELARLTGSRIASKGPPLVFKHSTGLMKVLIENGIPYRTASYRHPRYFRVAIAAPTVAPPAQAPANQQNPGSAPTQAYNYQQFSKALQQEAAQWQNYEFDRIIKSIATHAKAAGFPPAEVSQIQQNFQRVAQQENLQTAMYMALNQPDILHSAHQTRW